MSYQPHNHNRTAIQTRTVSECGCVGGWRVMVEQTIGKAVRCHTDETLMFTDANPTSHPTLHTTLLSLTALTAIPVPY